MIIMTFKELLDDYRIICKQQNKEISAIKLLIYDHFKLSNTQLYMNYDNPIEDASLKAFKEKARKYIYEGIPIQYIIGYTYFYNSLFIVTPDVLIPRFETEILVEKIIQYADRFFPNKPIQILDIGTGTGCIAITLRKNIKNAIVDGVDISKDALEVAIQNAKLNETRINFFQSDLFSNVENNIKYDIIVSNPPYIPYEDKVDELVYNNEPHLALFAPNNGLFYYEEILKEAKRFLSDKSLIAFEIAYHQKNLIVPIINKYFPNSEYNFYKDFNEHFRVVIIKNFTR